MDGIHLDGMPVRLPPSMPRLQTLPPLSLERRAFHGDTHDQHRQNGMIITSSVFTALAVFFVGMRTVSRFYILRKPGIDDCLLLASAFLTVGFLVCLGVAVANHVGFPTAYLSADSITALSKDALAMQVLYYVNVCLIKVSILFTYLRFGVSLVFRRLCWGTIAFHCLLCVACVLAIFLQSHPLSHMWTPDGNLELAINLQAFFYATSGIHILTDFWILLLPAHALLRVRRPRAEKIALFCIFGAGLLGSIASIVRLYTIHQYFKEEDQLLHCLTLDMWGAIEMSVGTCCVSLTGIRPILSSTRGWLGSSSRKFSGSEKLTSGHTSKKGDREKNKNKNWDRGAARKQRRKSDFFFSQNRHKKGPRPGDLEVALYETGDSASRSWSPSQSQQDSMVSPRCSDITRPRPVATSSTSTTLNGSYGTGTEHEYEAENEQEREETGSSIDSVWKVHLTIKSKRAI
ncbi:cfem domain-containing protein [Ophiostoma piceae UAMH 11346]|uniref:Cfem domain-containing protein n=1 Tax=Ophiostoma piceae (strain UAMH 11346) TaxID=1262450 RepID=S3BUQ6_OPHP1|nr:cfem domain-containing protein [Ophiostoma piceae UAMH 11346]